jgi:hypothetical protein
MYQSNSTNELVVPNAMWVTHTLASPWQEGEDLWDQDEGDASVPTPHNPTPAPTGTKWLPRGGHTIPTLESSSPAPPRAEVGVGDERAEVASYSDLDRRGQWYSARLVSL